LALLADQPLGGAHPDPGIDTHKLESFPASAGHALFGFLDLFSGRIRGVIRDAGLYDLRALSIMTIAGAPIIRLRTMRRPRGVNSQSGRVMNTF